MLDFYNIDSVLSEEERAVRDSVRHFVDERVMPIIGDAYVQGRFPKELIPEMGELGVFGATLGNPSNLDLRRIFWKQLTLQGTTMGTPDDFRAMLGLLAEKSLRPVIDQVFPFAAVNDAFARMEIASQFGKIVVNVKEEQENSYV